MMLSSGEIANSVQAIHHTLRRDVIPSGYSIDSRTLSPGECFIAIRGRNFDGHQFVAEALSKGASLVIAQTAVPVDATRVPIIFVEDTLIALQRLASYNRRKWGKKVIGITGSTGKTTTKEITASILGSHFQVFKSVGNFNNQYGLPLSLLRLEERHDVAVIELGMSSAGEITQLSGIAQPDIGIVTNVKPVHLEFFKSLDGIARAKRELIEALPPDGIAILNNDDVRVRKFARVFLGEVLTYGIEAAAGYRVWKVENRGLNGCDFVLDYKGKGYLFRSPLMGIHNLYNCLPAIILAYRHGLDFRTIAEAIAQLKPFSGRGEILHFADGFSVINDTYNSNPGSLEAMINLLKNVSEYGRKILVAGEMLELGPKSPQFHRQSGVLAARAGFDMIVGVRGNAIHLVEGARQQGYKESSAIFFEDVTAAGAWLSRSVRSRDLILIKGSRGVRMELVIERLRADHPETWDGRASMG
jgi:UDP-N-acetylmuramoyl-tripeptide--D-alanyl-D-alanine ligase